METYDLHETGIVTECQEEVELKSIAHSMRKGLKEKQFDTLTESVVSRGNDQTEYVILPKGLKTVTPQVLSSD